MDDLIVLSPSFDHHYRSLEKVFAYLRKYKLRLNRPKCRFWCTKVKYLGHILDPEGIHTDPEKFFRRYPARTTKKPKATQ